MAVQSFEDIIASAQLSADERKLLDNIQQKVPTLKEGWLRQDDYSRKTQELAAERKQHATEIEDAAKMRVWADEKVPIWEALVAEGAIDEESRPLWPEEKKKLEKELEEAKRAALAGGDMDPAELERRVKELVAVSGEKLNAEQYRNLYASEGKKLVEETINTKYQEFEKNFNEKTIPFTTGFATSMATMALKYEKETGKEWTDEDQKAVFDLMAKEKDFNPRSAVTKYMEPTVREKATQAEIEKRATELADKKIKEMGGLPGGGREDFIPQGEAKGSLQRMLEASATEEGDIETQAQMAASAAAKELREGR